MHQRSPHTLRAKQLSLITIDQVAEFFQLPSSPQSLVTLTNQLQQVLQTSGKILCDQNFLDFAEYFWKLTSNTETAVANVLVNKLVEDFPALQDIHLYHGRQVHLLKKAQLLCADLYRQFSKLYPERFAFKDVDQLT